MIHIKIFLLILLLPISAQAQVSIVNALPEILEEDEKGWSRELSASIFWRDDNSKEKKLNLSGGGSLTYREPDFLGHFITRGAYERIDGNNQEANFMEHLRFRYSPGWIEGLYLEAFVQHEYDQFRALDARALIGTGPAYTIVESKDLDVMVGTAYMLEYIAFNNTSNELNHRWTNYLQIEIEPNDRFTIESISFAQFKFGDFGDYLVMSTLAAKVNATDWFGIKLGVGFDYDSRPPPDVKSFGTGITSEVFAEW